MKKILLFLITLFLLVVILSSCSISEELPKGVSVLDKEQALKTFIVGEMMIDSNNLDALYEISKYVVKIKILEKQYIEFEDMYIKDETKLTWIQQGTLYEAKVIEVIYGEEFSDKKKIRIYSPSSLDTLYPMLVRPQKNNEYIVFLNPKEDYGYEGMKGFSDYNFTDEYTGVILCKSNNTYIVNSDLLGNITVDKKVYEPLNVGNDYERYFDLELVPEEYGGSRWYSFTLDDINSLIGR